MACLLVIAWFAIFALMIRAVVMKDILWPQKQEDREEGGWKTHSDELQACDTRECDPASLTRTISAPRRRWTDSVRVENVEHPSYREMPVWNGSGEGGDTHGHLPRVPERLIEESIHTGREKQSNHIV